MGDIIVDLNRRNTIHTDDIASDKIMDFAGHDVAIEAPMWEAFLLNTPEVGKMYDSVSVNAYDTTGSTIAANNLSAWVMGVRLSELMNLNELINKDLFIEIDASVTSSGNNGLRDFWLVRFQRENWHTPDDATEAWVNVYPFHRLPDVFNVNSGASAYDIVRIKNFENQTSFVDGSTASDDDADLGFDIGVAVVFGGVNGSQQVIKQVMLGMSIEISTARA